jgi:triacylglycerol esterase/lipase EstA (alpha/beta hydrolase family)
MSRHHVILIPGFFAFTGLGDLKYFSGVEEVLSRSFAARGLDVDVVEIQTLPTASIRYRAAKVLEAIAAVGHRDDGPIHLIGHSTGGLDARVAVTPHAALATSVKFDTSERVASLVTVATPHRGTPLASIFGSAMGQPLLRLLASIAVVGLERGKLPLHSLIKLGSLLIRLDDLFGVKTTFIDQLYEQLLSDFTDARRHDIIRFLQGVADDRALVIQLTPDSLDLFNATTADPDGICYGSVLTRARAPHVRGALAHYRDPYAQALYMAFSLSWLLTSQADPRYVPHLTAQQELAILQGFGELPHLRDNDGMSPTLSQIWGEVIHVANADHLDVVGQYGDDARKGTHVDWLPSGSGFDTAAFTALWEAVAAFVTRAGSLAKQ